MNFSYFENLDDFTSICVSCQEAEEFALIKPNISVASARKALEFIVKYIYEDVDPNPPFGLSIKEMIYDLRFRRLFEDQTLVNAMDRIRKVGNAAVHENNLSTHDALLVLKDLHFVAGEFAVGIGLINDYPVFEEPKLNPIREVMSRIHSDNFELSIIPYLIEEGHQEWANILVSCGREKISTLYKLPEEMICDAFFSFLKRFEVSISDEVFQLLELLPLSYADEKEWEQRRKTIPIKVVRRIECYVDALKTYQKNYTRGIWAEYSRILKEKAPGYVWLVHPELLPYTIREGVVKENALLVEDEEYVSLDEAIQQIIRSIAAESEQKRDQLTKGPWCKVVLGLPVPMLRNSKRGREDLGERNSLYCDNSVHFGDRRYIYYIAWDRASLMKLRNFAGDIGEKLITMDSLADWGFAIPGSDAEKRAKERAKRREALVLAQRERETEVAHEQEQEPRKRVKNKLPKDEASPLEIRNCIVEAGPSKWIPLLTSAQWSKENLRTEYPVLISYEERQYMLRKQALRGEMPNIYSRVMCEYEGETYFIKRMKVQEYESFKKIIEPRSDV